jgi:hypothetical protein
MRRQRRDIGGITITNFPDGRMAEITINPAKSISATTLMRVMAMNSVTAVKIIKSKPATGTPVMNVAHNGVFDDEA